MANSAYHLRSITHVISLDIWMVGCVAQLAERRSLAGELTRPALGLQPTGDHYVGKHVLYRSAS